jgi:hypothetical protein
LKATVKARPSCNPHEVQLDPLALGLQGLGIGALWKDANGAVVGASCGGILNYDFCLLRNGVSGKGIAITMTESGTPSQGLALYYSTSDCSGQGLMDRSGASDLAAFDLGSTIGTTVYYTSAAGETSFTAHSRLQRDPSFTGQIQCDFSVGNGSLFFAPDACCVAMIPQSLNGAYPETLDLGGFAEPFYLSVQ